MLFNSYEFIFLFLPITLVIFFLLGHSNLPAAKYWLTAASLFFYSWWRPVNVLLIGPSIAINYAIAKFLIAAGDTKPALTRAAFWFGICFNLCFLGYFKYLNFFATMTNDVLGTNYVLDNIILPLGISFITFQKIALLVDVRAGRVERVDLKSYALFVLFFPPLISGPIVHYRELMPQFEAMDGRWRWENLAVGGSLFFSGLFKKLVIADQIAGLISPIWQQAFQGQHPALLQAWVAALGYMAQLYFDFSGYSEMAIGAARLFGIKLPYNFNSPLKAHNIIEFWSRWHVTLTRFLTSYLFSPLALMFTRSRLGRGLPVMAGRRTTAGSFLMLVGVPTLVTMFLSGVWHGAGYQFAIFGVLHGIALVINHAWRLWKPRSWPDAAQGGVMLRVFSVALTMFFVVHAEVFFRAGSVSTALRVLGGMYGGAGVAMPPVLSGMVAPMLNAIGLTVQPSWEGGYAFVMVWFLVAVAWAIALFMPNTHEMLANYDPALGFKLRPGRAAELARWFWRPSAGWALAVSVVTLFGLMSLGQVSEFLYWKF